MEAGKLRHKLRIMQPTDSLTAKADNEITYPTNQTTNYCYGGIEPLAGRELQVAMQMRADITCKIELRGNVTGITHRTQFWWNDNGTIRKFNVATEVDTGFRHKKQTYYGVEIR